MRTLNTINIFIGSDIVNPSEGKIPIGFVSEVPDDLPIQLKKEEKFLDLLINLDIFINPDKYREASFSYLQMIIDDDMNVKYSNGSKSIQELWPLEDSDCTLLYQIVIEKIMTNLYELCFGGPIEWTGENLPGLEDRIRIIYQNIKDKYKDKVSDDTIINYILSKLNEKLSGQYVWSKENKDYIITNIKRIISTKYETE